jgi:hypothetical protein
MRRVFAWVAFILLGGAVGVSGETVITGNITTDTVWTLMGSPYIIHGPVSNRVVVRSGSTLTIEPGVEVRFEDGRTLETENGGSIVAIGAPGDSIVFTSDSATPTVQIWNSVTVFGATSSSFARCVFLYSKYGLYLSSASADSILSCSFRKCQTGIYCAQSSPSIVACEITGCTFAGISCAGRQSEPSISHCNLYGNTGHNVRLSSYAAPLVTIAAEFNWWGTTSRPAIEASIYDNLDDPSVYGIVDYDPYLSGTPVEATSWGVIKALFRE